jgi:hypothetical protein
VQCKPGEIVKKEAYINPFTSIAIMVGTVATVMFSGLILAVFSTTYESNCTPDTGGKSICTQTFKFKGWEAVPLQGLPGAIGTGLGIYAAFKSGKLPGQKEEEIEQANTP